MTSRQFVSRELLPCPDVLATFESLRHLPYPILFDSATAPGDAARYSFAAAAPARVVRAHGKAVTVHDLRARTVVHRTGYGLDVVAELLGQMRGGGVPATGGSRHEPPADEALPPFRGGAAGYVAYEYGRLLENVPAPSDDLGMPDLVMGMYEWVVAWDHATGRAWVMGEDDTLVESVVALVRERPRATAEMAAAGVALDARGSLAAGSCRPVSTFTKRAYVAAVRQVQRDIAAGEIFQANLSQRFHAPLSRRRAEETAGEAGWALYRRLRARNPAPCAAYFDFGDGAIASASPERFLLTNADGTVETRPIKGTRPRAAVAKRDAAAAVALTRSPKDAAEHVMIVDVLRNDLSRVCAAGSVVVPALMRHRQYATVHHLVSTITGTLRPGMDAVALLHACFPGGSITGAPKIRAMEIIARLEPVTRGAYCGSLGYISVTGAMDTNILIRTYVVIGDHVYFSAGGGIVADSVAADEYAETLVKARALMQALHA